MGNSVCTGYIGGEETFWSGVTNKGYGLAVGHLTFNA
jgi:hypothetical protein